MTKKEIISESQLSGNLDEWVTGYDDNVFEQQVIITAEEFKGVKVLFELRPNGDIMASWYLPGGIWVAIKYDQGSGSFGDHAFDEIPLYAVINPVLVRAITEAFQSLPDNVKDEFLRPKPNIPASMADMT